MPLAHMATGKKRQEISEEEKDVRVILVYNHYTPCLNKTKTTVKEVKEMSS